MAIGQWHFRAGLAQVKPRVVPMTRGEVGFPAKGRLLPGELAGGAGAGSRGLGRQRAALDPGAGDSRRPAVEGAAGTPAAAEPASWRAWRPVLGWRKGG